MMARLPLIVGFGGINAAGRSSFHHGYRRLVIDALDQSSVDLTLRSLAGVMGLQAGAELDPSQVSYILACRSIAACRWRAASRSAS
jgi:acetoacetyl-[acyl-carrier protein] synthase